MIRRIPILVGLLAIACTNGGEDQPGADPATTVQVAPAAETSFPVLVRGTATVTPAPGGVSELVAPGASRVTSVRVGPGDPVRPGQILLTLDPSVWNARLEEARAGVRAAEQARDRAARLVEQGILPRKDAELAAAELARTQAELASATLSRSLADVKSPIGGVVDVVDASIDELVPEGTMLVRIIDPQTIEVVFRLSPDQAADVEAGMPVTFGAESDSVALGEGRVLAVSGSIDPASGAVSVRSRIARSNRRLRIGEIVDGQIEIARHEHAVTVPAEAIVDVNGDRARVFIASEDGLALVRPVRIGGRDRGRIEVVEGLAAGERVITSGAYSLRDSARVTVGSGS